MKIEKIITGKMDNTYILSIFGNNFGPNKYSVWFDNMQIRDNNILSWDDNRIEASLGTVNLDANINPVHRIKVVRNSLLGEIKYVYRDSD